MGAAIGMAVGGLKPVVEIQFSGFTYSAFNQLANHAARLRNRSRGSLTVPMVLRTPHGGGIRAPEHHSECMEALFAHMRGLKVVIPSTPYDAKGLLIAAIRDPDPVVFLEPARIYRSVRQEVPEEAYAIEIGKARVEVEGTALTLVSYGAQMKEAREAVRLLARQGALGGADRPAHDLPAGRRDAWSPPCARPGACWSCTRPRSPSAPRPRSSPRPWRGPSSTCRRPPPA